MLPHKSHISSHLFYLQGDVVVQQGVVVQEVWYSKGVVVQQGVVQQGVVQQGVVQQRCGGTRGVVQKRCGGRTGATNKTKSAIAKQGVSLLLLFGNISVSRHPNMPRFAGS